jgi:hypothetical protein
VVKRCTLLSIALICSASYLRAQNKPLKDSTSIIITLDNSRNQNKQIDSVYLVFDSYERNAAGLVKQVFYPVGNQIQLTLPKGKYYVDVYCLGAFTDRQFNQIVNARKKRTGRLSVKLRQQSFFMPGLADIPNEQIDLANLSITRYTSSR